MKRTSLVYYVTLQIVRTFIYYTGPIDIDRGPQLYADLKKAQSSLVVDNFLHLLYLVTPYDLVDKIEPKWMIYMNEVGYLINL